MNLREALASVEQAKSYVSQNRGYDKELAREGVTSCIAEELQPALLGEIENLDEKDIIRVARFVLKIKGVP